MPGQQAGSGVSNYNAESPKQDSKRFNSITKTIQFAHLVLLLIYGTNLKVQCPEPETGQQKVQLYYEDDPICQSSPYYLSMAPT